jgi:hypothetical protein
MTVHKDKDTAAHHMMLGLDAIDEQVTKATGGEPGTGLYTLLNMVAGQMLGVPRAAFPTPPAPVSPSEAPAVTETVNADTDTSEGDKDNHAGKSRHRR